MAGENLDESNATTIREDGEGGSQLPDVIKLAKENAKLRLQLALKADEYRKRVFFGLYAPTKDGEYHEPIFPIVHALWVDGDDGAIFGTYLRMRLLEDLVAADDGTIETQAWMDGVKEKEVTYGQFVKGTTTTSDEVLAYLDNVAQYRLTEAVLIVDSYVNGNLEGLRNSSGLAEVTVVPASE